MTKNAWDELDAAGDLNDMQRQAIDMSLIMIEKACRRDPIKELTVLDFLAAIMLYQVFGAYGSEKAAVTHGNNIMEIADLITARFENER